MYDVRNGSRWCKAVVESTGNMWLKTFEAFESNGIDIKLANLSRLGQLLKPKSRQTESTAGGEKETKQY
ncbi:MAG: hypothetical protein ACYCQJ_02785 [Nitrososphaerales archaeon]